MDVKALPSEQWDMAKHVLQTEEDTPTGKALVDLLEYSRGMVTQHHGRLYLVGVRGEARQRIGLVTLWQYGADVYFGLYYVLPTYRTPTAEAFRAICRAARDFGRHRSYQGVLIPALADAAHASTHQLFERCATDSIPTRRNERNVILYRLPPKVFEQFAK
jgi:hypothetical protein